MIGNFLAMPITLKLFSLSFIGLILFIFLSAVPDSSLLVFGERITTTEWWAVGAGTISVVVGATMTMATFLILRRSVYGRPMYIFSWVLATLSILFVYVFFKGEAVRMWSIVSGNALITLFIAIYLYSSSSINNYFNVSGKGVERS